MTEKEYNEKPGIRRSDLWRMKESPEKYKWYLEHPAEETPALLFGQAAHKLVLEADSFDLEYAIAPAVDRRTNAGKDAWKAFQQEAGGKTVISAENFETILGMRAELDKSNLPYKMLVSIPGKTEEAFFWKDPETGEQCKMKCDRIIEMDGKPVVIDYKTTACAETERFVHEMFKYGYYVQAAMYTEGVMIAKGLKERPRFMFVAQEKNEPYCLNVIEVTDDVMYYGDSIYHMLLNRIHECNEMDDWPGYCDGEANEAFLPGWVNVGEEDE